eukprot:3137628-Pyramimonas_sp.AAC.1
MLEAFLELSGALRGLPFGRTTRTTPHALRVLPRSFHPVPRRSRLIFGHSPTGFAPRALCSPIRSAMRFISKRQQGGSPYRHPHPSQSQGVTTRAGANKGWA